MSPEVAAALVNQIPGIITAIAGMMIAAGTLLTIWLGFKSKTASVDAAAAATKLEHTFNTKMDEYIVLIRKAEHARGVLDEKERQEALNNAREQGHKEVATGRTVAEAVTEGAAAIAATHAKAAEGQQEAASIQERAAEAQVKAAGATERAADATERAAVASMDVTNERKKGE